MYTVFRWTLVLSLLFPAISFGQQTVNLAWDPPASNNDGTPVADIAGYRLYMGFEPIPDNKGTSQLVAETGVGVLTASASVFLPPTGSIVYFRVLAIDLPGNEGPFSNQVSIDFLPPGAPLLRIISEIVETLQGFLKEQERIVKR